MQLVYIILSTKIPAKV